MSNTIKSPIEQPIEQQHTGKGIPSVILHHGTALTNRQQELLAQLPAYDSKVIVPKNSVNMIDLSALTAVTGVEFAMFTKGQERLIIRGNEKKVNVNTNYAAELNSQGYRWSGHTHLGTDGNSLFASKGDYDVLNSFNQRTSVVYNSIGNFSTFEKR
jgi:hypothetical protein